VNTHHRFRTPGPSVRGVDTKEEEKMANNEMPDAEELRKIMQTLSETVPGLLESLTKVIYGEKESTEFGKAVANFYKTLVDAGMSSDQAFRLTRDYMSNISLGNMMRGMSGMGESGRKERAED
jgi:hypothetical protein